MKGTTIRPVPLDPAEAAASLHLHFTVCDHLSAHLSMIARLGTLSDVSAFAEALHQHAVQSRALDQISGKCKWAKACTATRVNKSWCAEHTTAASQRAALANAPRSPTRRARRWTVPHVPSGDTACRSQ